MAETTVKYVYRKDEDAWLGYLEEFPDYPTQGATLADLEDHLRDLYADLTGARYAAFAASLNFTSGATGTQRHSQRGAKVLPHTVPDSSGVAS